MSDLRLFAAGKEKQVGMEKDNILQESMPEKRSKKRTVVIIGILALISIMICIGISIYNKPGNRLERALALGQEYLLEEDYEQAIVEFDKAIEIEPANVEAYLGKAEAYIGLEDLAAAAKVLEKGYELTGSNEILHKLEELQGRNEETEIEELAEDKGDEYGIPYFELGFSPEDFTVAGYSVMDGDHIDDVLQAAAEIMPDYDDVELDFEYEGWSYVYITDISSVELNYNTLRFGHYGSRPVSYSGRGNTFMIFVTEPLVTLDMNLPADDPANEFPLYDGPIVPCVTSYEESLDILGIRQLIQAVEATESDDGVKRLEFESQYGTGQCWKYEEVQENKYMEIGIILYSRERGINWSLDFEVKDDVLSMVRIYTELPDE